MTVYQKVSPCDKGEKATGPPIGRTSEGRVVTIHTAKQKIFAEQQGALRCTICEGGKVKYHACFWGKASHPTGEDDMYVKEINIKGEGRTHRWRPKFTKGK